MKKRQSQLDFESQSFLTDVDDVTWGRVYEIILPRVSRGQRLQPELRLRAWFNAILYLSLHRNPWKKIKNHVKIRDFYYRLKKKNMLGLLQRVCGLPYPLLLERKSLRKPTRRDFFERPRCPECEQHPVMKGNGSHERGSVRVRHFICERCGHTSVQIDTGGYQWWRDPLFKVKKSVQNG